MTSRCPRRARGHPQGTAWGPSWAGAPHQGPLGGGVGVSVCRLSPSDGSSTSGTGNAGGTGTPPVGAVAVPPGEDRAWGARAGHGRASKAGFHPKTPGLALWDRQRTAPAPSPHPPPPHPSITFSQWVAGHQPLPGRLLGGEGVGCVAPLLTEVKKKTHRTETTPPHPPHPPGQMTRTHHRAKKPLRDPPTPPETLWGPWEK